MSEETRSYYPWKPIVVAIIIASAAVAAYVYFARVPDPYSAKLISLNVYPIHRNLTSPTTVQGIGGENETYDEVLVLADVRINNIAKIPLYLSDMSANVDLPDETQRSSAVSASDFDKLFIVYPDLKQYQKPMLPRDLTIQPGQSVEGLMIFSYQISQQQWQSASAMNINVDFIHQKPLVIPVPKSK
jgi:hypothetical protein